MSNPTPDTLPTTVKVPEWVREDEAVTLPLEGKVTGHLDLRALLPNDVLVTGVLFYRGNEYHVRWEHVTDAGDPYIYDQHGRERLILTSLPVEGWEQWRISEWLGGAPKTFRQPLLDAIKATVQDYLAHNKGHVRKCREANLIQAVNRKGGSYNEHAAKAAEALVEYEAAQAALSAYRGEV